MANDIRLNVVIDPELKRMLKVKAAEEGKTLTDVVLELLRKWMGLKRK